MTLFLACLLIYGLHLPEWLYIITWVLWLYQVGFYAENCNE